MLNNMHGHRRSQHGVTLVELLVGLLVGLVVLGAATSAFLTSIGAQTDNLNLARLNQDMRSMMDIMTRDIRRAGFVTSDPATNNAALRNNPFFSADKDIGVLSGGSCIVYSYNANDDSPPTVNSNEHFGFRLINGELQMRSSGSTNTACDDGSWETITEPEIIMTDLTFVLDGNEDDEGLNATSMATDSNGDGVMDGDTGGDLGDSGNGFCDTGEACNTCQSGEACLYVRAVTITLTGQLRDDNTVSQSITQQVRLRNDKFVESL